MNIKELEQFVVQKDRENGKAVYTTAELSVLLKKKTTNALKFALHSLVKNNFFLRVSKGIFLYKFYTKTPDVILGQIVHALRFGQFSYLSLESVLSACGVISQIPFTLTFMTTGRSGVFNTPMGRIEFTHTKRDLLEIFDDVIWNGNYYQAKPKKALSDLKTVGRNTHLLIQEEIEQIDEL